MQIIRRALISTYHKDGVDRLARQLHDLGVEIYASEGTSTYLEGVGVPARGIGSLTQYPELLGGRVKTLHPKIFGGLLYRVDRPQDMSSLDEYGIPRFDVLVVDLYPFEEALVLGASEGELIEQIDIGGVALLRAAAKNFQSIWVISSKHQYEEAIEWLKTKGARTTEAYRRRAALQAFRLSAHYDAQIAAHFGSPPKPVGVQGEGVARGAPSTDAPAQSVGIEAEGVARGAPSTDAPARSVGIEAEGVARGAPSMGDSATSVGVQARFGAPYPLRYGENAHQQATFYGPLSELVSLLSGKALSYNNLLDLDAAFQLLRVLEGPHSTFVIIKHTNPCGVGVADTPLLAYQKAFTSDSRSAFGGVFASNRPIDRSVAEEISSIFFELLLAPSFSRDAFELLKQKKNRRLLEYHSFPEVQRSFRSILNGVLEQSSDLPLEDGKEWTLSGTHQPTEAQWRDLRFAYAVAASARSNAIVIAKDGQLLGCGAGQTSRIDALRVAIEKAKANGHTIEGAAMASEAFFPFPDCVEMAYNVGIRSVIQPGGSTNDQLSIDFCSAHQIPMVLSKRRHFRH